MKRSEKDEIRSMSVEDLKDARSELKNELMMAQRSRFNAMTKGDKNATISNLKKRVAFINLVIHSKVYNIGD